MGRPERMFDAITNYLFILFIQIKSLVGTPEFVAPEVVNYDFISTGTGNVELILKQNSFLFKFVIFRHLVTGSHLLYFALRIFSFYGR